MMAPELVQAPGDVDVWKEFFSLSDGHEVNITMPRALLFLIWSLSTAKVELVKRDGSANLSSTDKEVSVRVVGPLCDNQQPLRAQMVLTADIVHDPVIGLTKDEQRSLYRGVGRFYATRGVYMVQKLHHFRAICRLPNRVK